MGGQCAGVLVCLCVFFFLPVDAPGPVHQIAELCSLVFGLENKNSHTQKNIHSFACALLRHQHKHLLSFYSFLSYEAETLRAPKRTLTNHARVDALIMSGEAAAAAAASTR